MSPRPIYRWKSFWLGLFVLTFFGGPWDKPEVGVELGSLGERSFQVGRGPRETVWMVGRPLSTTLTSNSGTSVRTSTLCGVSYHPYAFPDSAAFVSFLALWAGWLGWRWRRMQQVAS